MMKMTKITIEDIRRAEIAVNKYEMENPTLCTNVDCPECGEEMQRYESDDDIWCRECHVVIKNVPQFPNNKC